jgi:O-antigen/teichoic acid export membrane protein
VNRRLLAQVSVLSSAHYISQALFLVRGLLLARILGPAAFGIWAAMRLVLLGGRFTHFGSVPGMVQHASRAQGQGEEELATRYRDAAAFVNLLGGAVVSIGLGLWLWFRGPSGWLAVPFLLFALNLYEFHLASLRSRRRFTAAAAARVAFALLSTGVGVWAALAYGLGGFLVALGGSYGLVLVVSTVATRTRPRPTWDRRRAAELVRFGSPVLASDALQVLLWNTDKLLIWLFVGSEMLGMYAVPATIAAAVMLLPLAISRVLHPHLAVELGKSPDPSGVWPSLEQGTVLLAQVACPVLGLLFLGLHLPIRWWLAPYLPAIEPGLVLVLATFFPIVASVPATILIALGAQKRLLVIRIFAVAVSAAAIAGALASRGTLVAVALAAAAGFLTQSAFTMAGALRVTGLPARRAATLLAGVVGPFLLLVLLLLGVTRAVPDDPSSWSRDVAATAARAVIVAAVLVPLAIGTARRRGLAGHTPVGLETTS